MGGTDFLWWAAWLSLLLVPSLVAQRLLRTNTSFEHFIPADGSIRHSQQNPLYLLAESRKVPKPLHLQQLLTRTNSQQDAVMRLSKGSHLKCFEATHFVNHTHMTFIQSSTPIETEIYAVTELAILDVQTQQLTHVTVNESQSAGCGRFLHHDARFYSTTQTFLALTKCQHHGKGKGIQNRDRLLEVDLAGNVVWEWNPSLDSLLPPCMKKGWSGGSNKNDCHHTNSIHYSDTTDTIFLCIRRLNGFLALRKSTKEIRWVYSERLEIRPIFGRKALSVCAGGRAPWPIMPQCKLFGFHAFQEVAPDVFWVFANCDASGRAFTVDHHRSCLLPLQYYALPDDSRSSHGAVYRVPWGVLVATGAQAVSVWTPSAASDPAVIPLSNSYWCDPVLLAPFLNITAQPGKLLVRMAHHLWVPDAVHATLSCATVPADALPCPDSQAVSLGPFMTVTEWGLLTPGNSSEFQFIVSLRTPSGASATVEAWVASV